MPTTNPPVTSGYLRRVDRAQVWSNQPFAAQSPNGDEDLYPDHRASYSKGLPHNSLGEVDPDGFNALIDALGSGSQADFNDIPLGSTSHPEDEQILFTNPQGGLAAELVGPNPRQLRMEGPPPFAGTEIAAEIAENYWMALTRDIHFSDYAVGNTLIDQSVVDLNTRSAKHIFPQQAGAIIPKTLFRGVHPGDNVGPYVSQFLLQDCYFGTQQIDQKMRTVLSGADYMTSFNDWLSVQNGVNPGGPAHDAVRRYIRNGRDLSEWVHIDVLYQAYFNAMLILLTGGARADTGNPYRSNTQITKEAPFGSFGPPHIAALLPEVATRALHAVWYQKWFVHRRLRPEVFAARVHQQQTGVKDYAIHPDLFSSSALAEVHAKYGSYLLPMAFREGSPTHPAYGAGHATVAGACTTILKAWFAGAQKFSELIHPITKVNLSPKVASADGLALVDYSGADKDQLTVGGELNKLASNIAIGRNIAGVHYRSDYTESIKLGEEVAIGTLVDYAGVYAELDVGFEGFHLQKFAGIPVLITRDGEMLM